MDERELLRVLRARIADGQVAVTLDCGRLGHTDSPVAVQADSNRWIYGIAAGALAAWHWGDWRRALAAIAVGVALYWAVGRPWVRRRMRARFYDSVLADIAAFKKLWHLKGVDLADRRTGAVCVSPAGDWRRFVLDRLVDGGGGGTVPAPAGAIHEN